MGTAPESQVKLLSKLDSYDMLLNKFNASLELYKAVSQLEMEVECKCLVSSYHKLAKE